LELERQRHSKQACLETPRVVWPTPGSLFGPRKPMESVTRGFQTVARRSGSHGYSLKCIYGNTGVPQKRPIARDVQTSPSLRRDLLGFGSAFGEPVTAPNVVHTWPFGWTVGSIGGDALTPGTWGSTGANIRIQNLAGDVALVGTDCGRAVASMSRTVGCWRDCRGSSPSPRR